MVKVLLRTLPRVERDKVMRWHAYRFRMHLGTMKCMYVHVTSYVGRFILFSPLSHILTWYCCRCWRYSMLGFNITTSYGIVNSLKLNVKQHRQFPFWALHQLPLANQVNQQKGSTHFRIQVSPWFTEGSSNTAATRSDLATWARSRHWRWWWWECWYKSPMSLDPWHNSDNNTERPTIINYCPPSVLRMAINFMDSLFGQWLGCAVDSAAKCSKCLPITRLELDIMQQFRACSKVDHLLRPRTSFIRSSL